MNRSRLKCTFMLHFQNETNLQAGTNQIITEENILPSLVTGIGAVPQARRVYNGQSEAKWIDLKSSMGGYSLSPGSFASKAEHRSNKCPHRSLMKRKRKGRTSGPRRQASLRLQAQSPTLLGNADYTHRPVAFTH